MDHFYYFIWVVSEYSLYWKLQVQPSVYLNIESYDRCFAKHSFWKWATGCFSNENIVEFMFKS